MSLPRQKPATTPIPGQLSATEFDAFLLPHLAIPTRGPQCKLGYQRVFHLLLWGLYTGMHWKCLPLAKETHGKPALHDTPVSRACARWADDGALQRAFVASVWQLAAEQQLDLRVLPGDGTNTVGKTGAMGLAMRATSLSKGRRASP
jgi:transposase